MTSSVTRAWRSGRRDPLLLLLLGAALFLPGLGNHDLWNPDEPRYFEVCREMSESGEYFVPHLNGRLYTQKPPLLFWSMCGAARVVGFNATAARLPSALAAMTSIVVVWLLARLFFPLTAARLAALTFATSTKTLWQGHTGQIDMLLACLVLVAVYFWARSWVEDRPRLVWLFYVFAGLATLAKGPVGLLPPLLSIVVFLVIRKDWRGLSRLRVGRGLLLWVAVVLLWLAPAILRGGDVYMQEILFKQNVTRYMNPWHHFQPWYYYLTVLPGDFLPWSFFLPASVLAGLRYLAGQERRRFFFALSWIVVTVVFFSVSPAKRTVYILTMYPAMALVVGAGLDVLARAFATAAEPPTSRRWLSWPAAMLAALFSLVVLALPWVARGREDVAPMGPGFALHVSLAVAMLAMGSLAAWDLARRGRVTASVMSMAGGMALTGIAVFTVLLPRLDIVKSVRPMSEELVMRAAPEEPYTIYPRLDAGFLYYTRRFSVEISGEEELHAFAARPGRVWVLIRRKALAKLEKPLPLEEVARDADVVNGYVLFSSRGYGGRDRPAMTASRQEGSPW